MTWKSMGEEDKAKWHDEAKKELEKHKKRFPKYAFKPQQTKGKGAGSRKGNSGDGGGGGTAKRRVREVEPKDDKRCGTYTSCSCPLLCPVFHPLAITVFLFRLADELHPSSRQPR
jgi:hypothetical protein